MMLHRMGWPFSKVIYPQLTWTRPAGPAQEVFLTFDDGPIPEVTEFVLDALAQYGASATFFCVGDNVRKHPALFGRLLREGHQVGNHTQHHLNGWNTPLAQYADDAQQCRLQMEALGGLRPGAQGKPLFRPPYGRIGRAQMARLLPHYEIVMWHVLSGDFSPTLSPERCLSKTLQYTRPGSIVVFHDNLKAIDRLYYALPRFLQHAREQGWAFGKL
jgi:peptidoglycan/xylan/chitin deacetylase (PgdA/CDA1 family)